MDKEGHIIHIDFGFLLTTYPGKGLKIEQAPFKLTSDLLNVIGGTRSENFFRFNKSMIDGFYILNQNMEKIILMVQMIANSLKDLPCFGNGAD